jgi:magnesium transporter
MMHGMGCCCIIQDLEVSKAVIMRQVHLPARDLRLLDPLLSYPSSILGREHAIVVNLEHIKTIITAQEVFLLDAQNPRVAPFVQELRLRLPSNHSNQVEWIFISFFYCNK